MVIEQALFGYNNGHRLLVSSFVIPQDVLKVLEPLSDSSGTSYNQDYSDGYLIGFPFNAFGFYCVGKTWTAHEMQRPGCVWTHVLFIPMQDQSTAICNIDLNQLFIRPNINKKNWEKEYTNKIIKDETNQNIYNKASVNNLCSTYFEKILSAFLQRKTPLVIVDSDILAYNNAIVSLINSLPIKFFSNISFCTCSFSNRCIQNKPLTIQVTPDIVSKAIWRENNLYKYDDINKVETYCAFSCLRQAIKYSINQLENFNCTMLKFVIDYLIQCNEVDNNNQRIAEIVKSAIEIFSLEKKDSRILLLLFRKWFTNILTSDKEYVVFATQNLNDSSCFSEISESEISVTINPLFQNNDKKLLALTRNLVDSDLNIIGEQTLKVIAKNISEKSLQYMFDDSFYTIYPLLLFNKEIALYNCIWRQNYEIQSEVLKTINVAYSKESENLRQLILYKVYENSEQNIANKVFELFGNIAIEALYDCMNKPFIVQNIFRHTAICNCNILLSIDKLSTLYSREAFAKVISSLNPYNNEVLSVSTKYWNRLYETFCNACHEDFVEEAYAKFLLPIILRSNKEFPFDLTTFAFKTVHDILLRDAMPYSEWDKLSALLPEIAFYKMWDKCKRVRKAAKVRGLHIDFTKQ